MDRQARERKGEEMMKFRKEKEERDRILRECEQMRSEARFLRTRTKPSLVRTTLNIL